MRPTRPTVVLFDLGGVLLPFERERRVSAMVEALGVTADAARGLVAGGIAEQLDLGEADEAALAAAMGELCGRPVAADEARRLWLSVFEPPNRALWALVGDLRTRVVTGALSDNPGFVREVFPSPDPFDHLFLSCELGLAKPSPAVFADVTSRLAVSPEEILFVDDMAANIDAARTAGWDAALYVSNDQLAAELSRRGL